PLIVKSRADRGLPNDITGCLLCPIEFNWEHLQVRADIRASKPGFDISDNYFLTCLYPKGYGIPDDMERFFLCSSLLVKVYKSIFTVPSSAKDVSEDDGDRENVPPAKARKISNSRKQTVKCNVASKLHMNDKVTPRSIAYAAVQLHFNLQTADRWLEIYGGFDYRGLYNYIINFFEDVHEPATKKHAQDLLNWWSM
ncbi:hypothetical protein BDZ97DRAFT_1668205, partial [Flammula alnicola]